MGTHRHPNASVAGIWPISSLKVVYSGPRGSFLADFRILGGVGDINNSISLLNYCDGPYSDLGVYVKKILSAWTEVWIGTWRSSILAPGGRSGLHVDNKLQ